MINWFSDWILIFVLFSLQMCHKVFTWRQRCVSPNGKIVWRAHRRKRLSKVRWQCKRRMSVMSNELRRRRQQLPLLQRHRSIQQQIPAFRHANIQMPMHRSIRRKCHRKNSKWLQTVSVRPSVPKFRAFSLQLNLCALFCHSFPLQNWKNPKTTPPIAKWKSPHRKWAKRISRERIRICRQPVRIIMTWILAARMDPFHAVKIHRRYPDTAIVTNGKPRLFLLPLFLSIDRRFLIVFFSFLWF